MANPHRHPESGRFVSRSEASSLVRGGGSEGAPLTRADGPMSMVTADGESWRVGPGMFHEIGSTGLMIFGGFVLEELMPELRPPLAAKVYREIGDNDAIGGTMLNAIDLTSRRAEPIVEAAGPSNIEMRAAELCESALYDMVDGLPETRASWLSSLQHGFAIHEMNLKKCMGMNPGVDEVTGRPLPKSKFKDGMVRWESLPIRGQETIREWHLPGNDSGSEYPGRVVQYVNGRGLVDLPYDKLLHHRAGSALKGNPLGFSLFRRIWRSWLMKRRDEELEAIGIERDLAGIPVVYMPVEYIKEITEDHAKVKRAMVEMVKFVRRNEAEGIVMPQEFDRNGNPLFKFELATTGGRRQFDITATITRLEQRQLMTAFTDFLMLGHEGVGTLGMEFGNTKVDLFIAACGVHNEQQAAPINSVGFPTLCELNGFPPETCPSLRFSQLEQDDVDEAAATLLKVSQGGGSPYADPQVLHWILTTLRIPHDEKALLHGLEPQPPGE